MDAEPVVAVDENDGRRGQQVRCGDGLGIGGNGRRGFGVRVEDRPQDIEFADQPPHVVVMPFDAQGGGGQGAGNKNRDPAALEELHAGHHNEDKGRQDQAQAVEAQPFSPMGGPAPHLPPVAHHAARELDIRVLDHLVVTENRFFSFQAEGML